MEEKLNQFKQLLAQIADLGRANALLGWDQQVNMPPGAVDYRAEQEAYLSGLYHKMFTGEEFRSILEKYINLPGVKVVEEAKNIKTELQEEENHIEKEL